MSYNHKSTFLASWKKLLDSFSLVYNLKPVPNIFVLQNLPQKQCIP
jgi:hypothetical protein